LNSELNLKKDFGDVQYSELLPPKSYAGEFEDFIKGYLFSDWISSNDHRMADYIFHIKHPK
jgi:hypothetical protein